MTYKLLINGYTFLSGTVAGGVLLVAIIIIALLLAAVVIQIMTPRRDDSLIKGEFITIVAHKFRTPLTELRWAIETMLTAETDPYKKETLNGMRQSNQQLIELTGTMIELVDLESKAGLSYAFNTVSLCGFVRDIAAQHKDVFHEKNLFFSVKCPAEDVMASVDAQRLGFVMQTLLENACTYTPPGNNVDVTVAREGNRAMVTVTDHGIGIDAADLPNIFSKFYRTDAAQRADTEGFGVALFLSRSIVERHKGKIQVSSPGLNQGTTFTVTLPVAK